MDLCQNTGLAAPLLSRFDLIFVIVDNVETEKDEMNCDFILNKVNDVDFDDYRNSNIYLFTFNLTNY